MKSYWRLYDEESGATVFVVEKEIQSNRDLDFINEYKLFGIMQAITEDEYRRLFREHGVEPVGAIPKPNQ